LRSVSNKQMPLDKDALLQTNRGRSSIIVTAAGNVTGARPVSNYMWPCSRNKWGVDARGGKGSSSGKSRNSSSGRSSCTPALSVPAGAVAAASAAALLQAYRAGVLVAVS
jgi:hypothetical protein